MTLTDSSANEAEAPPDLVPGQLETKQALTVVLLWSWLDHPNNDTAKLIFSLALTCDLGEPNFEAIFLDRN